MRTESLSNNSHCYENSARPPRHVVLRSPRRRTWGGVGLDHAKRRRYFHPLMWPSQGHGDSGARRIPAPQEPSLIQSLAAVVNSDWRRRSHFHPLGVPVTTGMSDCYENNTRPPCHVVPSPEGPGAGSPLPCQQATPFQPLGVPVATGMGGSRRGGNPSPVGCVQVSYEAVRHHHRHAENREEPRTRAF